MKPELPPSVMTLSLQKGTYVARVAASEGDLRAAQRLRHLCFVERAGGKPRPDGLDVDAFDAVCQHVLIEHRQTGRLVGCFRLLRLRNGTEIGKSYAAQVYDLSGLRGFVAPMIEMGRFCIHPDVQNADVLRVAWGAIARFVDAQGVELLFGCSSFAGTAADPYLDALAMLRDRHLAPGRWMPQVKAENVFRFAEALAGLLPDPRLALVEMPPLLRTYLLMGGWVSDHAVIDTDLNTLHVFTGLEIRAIPPARARALRAVAEDKNFI